jgi:transcription termination/antitermination protein NusG
MSAGRPGRMDDEARSQRAAREEMRHGPEGGEALLSNASIETDPAWRVLWTHSRCEQQVHDQLATRGFEAFLPKIDVWSRRGRFRHLSRQPMFPGYLFLRHPLDKTAYLEVRKTRGLVSVLGAGWDRPATVSESEIEAIRAVCASGLAALPHVYLKQGQRVRIVRGPLAEVEGILLRSRPDRGLLVLSVDLLRRSVAVEIDCTSAIPA